VLACREQLKDRQRFIVVSLGQRLLVFLPTPSGELLLLLPRDAENTDDLVQEVVQSVMKVSVLRQILCCWQPPGRDVALCA
jgi:hypothetical protein